MPRAGTPKKRTRVMRRKAPQGSVKKGKVKATRKRKPGRKVTIDWVRAKALYVTTLDLTYRDIAKEVGAHEDTISEHGRAEDWPGVRAENRELLVQEGLERALEEKKKGVAALVHLEYQESMSIISMLQSARRQAIAQEEKENGAVTTRILWTPKQLLDYTRAFREVTGLARLSMGLPTEIRSSKVELGGHDGGPIAIEQVDYSQLSTQELSQMRALMKKAAVDTDDEDSSGGA